MSEFASQHPAETEAFATPRLWLPPLEDAEAAAILGLRPPNRLWADGYPSDGDKVVASMVLADPVPIAEQAFGPRQMVLRARGTVIGGIGFFGPAFEGALAVGYGIAPKYRGQGLVSEALRALLAFAAGCAQVRQVYADTEPDNLASQHVLLACGFVRSSDRDGLRVFCRSVP